MELGFFRVRSRQVESRQVLSCRVSSGRVRSGLVKSCPGNASQGFHWTQLHAAGYVTLGLVPSRLVRSRPGKATQVKVFYWTQLHMSGPGSSRPLMSCPVRLSLVEFWHVKSRLYFRVTIQRAWRVVFRPVMSGRLWSGLVRSSYVKSRFLSKQRCYMSTSQPTEQTGKPRFIKSADTSIIENLLRTTEVGGTLAYDDISRALGRDVREHCRANLNSARKSLIAESIYFRVESGVGLVRLSQEEAVIDSEKYVSRAKSSARSGMRHLQNVEFNKLDDETRKQYVAKTAQLGAIGLFASSKATKKITGAVSEKAETIAIGETLKLFGG